MQRENGPPGPAERAVSLKAGRESGEAGGLGLGVTAVGWQGRQKQAERGSGSGPEVQAETWLDRIWIPGRGTVVAGIPGRHIRPMEGSRRRGWWH